MKIIIPMAGSGKRYNEVAFHGPKPLVEIDGKPMIEHVINMFSFEDEFIFICHEEHLKETQLKKVLLNLAPKSKIVSVTTDQIRGGPLYTCSNVFNLVGDNEEVIINYCDFTLKWNYSDFLAEINQRRCDGAVISFQGFHPASLGDTYYAYLKVDQERYLTELREKEPFTKENRMDDYASTGTYYFRKWSDFKRYTQKVMDANMNTKGETYITHPYILMIKDGLKVLNYEVEKFICWGTPRDYEVYKFWSEFFFRRSGQAIGFNNVNIKTTNLFPIAGNKKDFKLLGFDTPNFLIPLMGKPLIASTVKFHPRGIRNIFICLEEHKTEYQLDSLLKGIFPHSETIYLETETKGNAETIIHAEKYLLPQNPICISGSSFILDYDERKLAHLFENEETDVILLTFTHHECVLRNPNYHSYLKFKNGLVERVYEKTTISSRPERDHAFTGTVIYRHASDLFNSIRRNMTRLDQEGYTSFTTYSFLTAVNELIKEGKKVAAFEVDKFVSLLTPQDYQEFIYWQDYFDSLSYHPYSKMVH
ncbi:MAG TPA: sugar phosphate nucleotidyltransferase [Candidatus Nanoarchaeia archaeon]|nr:sugar phosphate nucleotidyltransferase [Candidatus Nanoarchaeia archaeon]